MVKHDHSPTITIAPLPTLSTTLHSLPPANRRNRKSYIVSLYRQSGMQQPPPVDLNSSNSGTNMPLNHQPSIAIQSARSKYVKVWEGDLSGPKQGQPVFITRLEVYRSASASETLAANWPPVMQIVRLISQDHMNKKHYVGKADFLVFRAMNQHGFLEELLQKKLCAVIQLPSQTLLLSTSDRAYRLIAVLFPGDMVEFKLQIPNQQQLQAQLQQQQLQQQLPHMQRQTQQLHPQLQQQPLPVGQLQQQPHMQIQQQLQQQQMVRTGMNQAYIQGTSQQGQSGMQQPVGPNINNSGTNMPLDQQPSSTIQSARSKYVKVWEGTLSGRRQGQPVFITRLEGYRRASASETLATNWPPVMQIVRLISQDHMNQKYYVKADLLVFRAMSQHGFLGELQEKKLCAVIQLPSQTLLLSASSKAYRLIAVLFPGDMVVFNPQIPNQQQLQAQLQQQLPQMQQQMQQQPLTENPQQQQQQQQMVGTGMNQAYIQGGGRPYMLSQEQASSQGSTSMPKDVLDTLCLDLMMIN